MNKYTVFVVIDRKATHEVHTTAENPYQASNKVIERYEADGYSDSQINVLCVMEGWDKDGVYAK